MKQLFVSIIVRHKTHCFTILFNFRLYHSWIELGDVDIISGSNLVKMESFLEFGDVDIIPGVWRKLVMQFLDIDKKGSSKKIL